MGQMSLADLGAWLDGTERRRHAQRAVIVFGRKYHALALDAHQSARCEVGNEEHVAAYEFLRRVIFGNARHDGALLPAAVVKGEFQEFVGLLHLLAVHDVTHADVQLLPLVEGDVFLDRFGLAGGGFIGLLGGLQLLQLALDGLVVYLFKQQFGLG